MSYTATPPVPQLCGHCGRHHTGICPRIKSIEYNPDGTIKRIEFHDTQSAVTAYSTPEPRHD